VPKVFVQIFTLKFPLKFQHCVVFPCVFKLQLCVNFRYHQTVVSALQQRFHLDCFLCFHCKRPIANGLFHLEQGEPYCDEGMKYYQDSHTFRCKFVHDKLDSGLYCTPFRFFLRFFRRLRNSFSVLILCYTLFDEEGVVSDLAMTTQG
jgi:LIM domain